MEITDTTPQEALEEVKRQHGSDAPPLLAKRVQWVKYDRILVL